MRTLIIALFASAVASAQITTSNVKLLENLKKGTVYVVMKDTASAIALPYKNMYRACWTVSKIKFVNLKDMDKYFQDGNFFLTVNGFHVETPQYSNGVATNGMRMTNARVDLQLWTPEAKYLKKSKRDPIEVSDQENVARAVLFADRARLLDPKQLDTYDYDYNGTIRNWGVGMLKNQIQFLNDVIRKGEKLGFYSSFVDQEKIQRLKKQTLYVSDAVLVNEDTKDKLTAEDLFKDYKLPYKIISTQELDSKIMNDKESFYYLSYVKSSSTKYFSIYDSKTGEMIYRDQGNFTFNCTSKDMKNIFKAVNKE